MIAPVVAVLLIAIVPAVLALGLLAALTMAVGALAEIDAADGRLLRD